MLCCAYPWSVAVLPHATCDVALIAIDRRDALYSNLLCTITDARGCEIFLIAMRALF